MKILIEFAHPALQRSKVNKQLINAVTKINGVYVNDLYEIYPDFNIDVKREQALLLEHDLIVFQHPFYWYSCPALLKEWQDLVLEHNFAYGSKGKALQGKFMFSAITTGGMAVSYQPDGYNHYRVIDLLAPFKQTAFLCGITYLPPFLVQSTHTLSTKEDILPFELQYCSLLEKLRDDQINLTQALALDSLNQIQ